MAFSLGLLTSVYYYWVPKVYSILIELHRAASTAAANNEGLGNGVAQTKWGALNMTTAVVAVKNKDEDPLSALEANSAEKGRRGAVMMKHEEKKNTLLQKLRQQELPEPTDSIQERIIEELVDLKGSNLKAALCQRQIQYLQAIIVALSSAIDDSSNNSSSKPASTTTAAEATLETSAADLRPREKPESTAQ